MTTLDSNQVCQMLLAVCDQLIAAEAQLGEADRLIGDGDHGIGMQRGMTAARQKLETAPCEGIDGPFQAMGMALMTSMGGASGAIFGTMFRSGAKALADRSVFDVQALALFLRAGMEGVQQRGGAMPGDKTMLDALHPAVLAAEAAGAKHEWEHDLAATFQTVVAAAAAGVEASKALVARHGRARSLGQAAVGHLDPGALSMLLILQAMASKLPS